MIEAVKSKEAKTITEEFEGEKAPNDILENIKDTYDLSKDDLKDMKVEIETTIFAKCPSCGASTNGDKCSYCGTIVLKEKNLKIRPNAPQRKIEIPKAILPEPEYAKYVDDEKVPKEPETATTKVKITPKKEPDKIIIFPKYDCRAKDFIRVMQFYGYELGKNLFLTEAKDWSSLEPEIISAIDENADRTKTVIKKIPDDSLLTDDTEVIWKEYRKYAVIQHDYLIDPEPKQVGIRVAPIVIKGKYKDFKDRLANIGNTFTTKKNKKYELIKISNLKRIQIEKQFKERDPKKDVMAFGFSSQLPDNLIGKNCNGCYDENVFNDVEEFIKQMVGGQIHPSLDCPSTIVDTRIDLTSEFLKNIYCSSDIDNLSKKKIFEDYFNIIFTKQELEILNDIYNKRQIYYSENNDEDLKRTAISFDINDKSLSFKKEAIKDYFLLKCDYDFVFKQPFHFNHVPSIILSFPEKTFFYTRNYSETGLTLRSKNVWNSFYTFDASKHQTVFSFFKNLGYNGQSPDKTNKLTFNSLCYLFNFYDKCEKFNGIENDHKKLVDAFIDTYNSLKTYDYLSPEFVEAFTDAIYLEKLLRVKNVDFKLLGNCLKEFGKIEDKFTDIINEKIEKYNYIITPELFNKIIKAPQKDKKEKIEIKDTKTEKETKIENEKENLDDKISECKEALDDLKKKTTKTKQSILTKLFKLKNKEIKNPQTEKDTI